MNIRRLLEQSLARQEIHDGKNAPQNRLIGTNTMNQRSIESMPLEYLMNTLMA